MNFMETDWLCRTYYTTELATSSVNRLHRPCDPCRTTAVDVRPAFVNSRPGENTSLSILGSSNFSSLLC